MQQPGLLLLAACASWLLLCTPAGVAQGKIVAHEADARAALVYQLARFVEWPSETNAAVRPRARVIAVDSDDGVEESLKEIITGKTIGGQRVKVVALPRGAALPRPLDVIYTSRPHTWKRYATTLKQEAVLCIGSHPSFLEQGGDILLFRKDNHMAFSVNLVQLREKGLALHAQVLHLAEDVRHEALP